MAVLLGWTYQPVSRQWWRDYDEEVRGYIDQNFDDTWTWMLRLLPDGPMLDSGLPTYEMAIEVADAVYADRYQADLPTPIRRVRHRSGSQTALRIRGYERSR